MSLTFYDLQEAFHAGYAKGFTDADQGGQDAFQAGYDEGYRVAGLDDVDPSADQTAYNDGYIDGVADARVCPEEADAYVAGLCEVDDYDDQADEDGFDGTYEPEYGWVNSCAYDIDAEYARWEAEHADQTL